MEIEKANELNLANQIVLCGCLVYVLSLIRENSISRI